MAKDLEQRFDSAMKKGEKQDRAKGGATVVSGDKKGFQDFSKGAIKRDLASAKRQGTSTGYMTRIGTPERRAEAKKRNANKFESSQISLANKKSAE